MTVSVVVTGWQRQFSVAYGSHGGCLCQLTGNSEGHHTTFATTVNITTPYAVPVTAENPTGRPVEFVVERCQVVVRGDRLLLQQLSQAQAQAPSPSPAPTLPQA